MIDVLIPVLRRPARVRPVVESIRSASRFVKQILFLVSEDDKAEIMAVEEVGAEYASCKWKPGPADYAKKMNTGFLLTDSAFVFLGADDLDFKPGWDVSALEAAFAGAGVIATNDLANPEVKKGIFGTHCLVRRSYVKEHGASLEGPGHLLSEAYDHNFVDRELCHLADSRDLYAFAEKSHVQHLHPHWGTAEMDATYRKGLANFRQDRRLFLRRIQGLPT
jgi:hypothetical protein